MRLPGFRSDHRGREGFRRIRASRRERRRPAIPFRARPQTPRAHRYRSSGPWEGNDRRLNGPPATWIRLPNTAMMASWRGRSIEGNCHQVSLAGRRLERAKRREVTTVLHLAPGSVDDAVQSGRVEPAACCRMGGPWSTGVRDWIVGLHQVDVAGKPMNERPAQPPTDHRRSCRSRLAPMWFAGRGHRGTSRHLFVSDRTPRRCRGTVAVGAGDHRGARVGHRAGPANHVDLRPRRRHAAARVVGIGARACQLSVADRIPRNR